MGKNYEFENWYRDILEVYAESRQSVYDED